jgi:hypothetical protein
VIRRLGMEGIIIPLVSVGISAVVALITTLITLRSSRKHSLEQDSDKALEELQNIYLDVKLNIKEEIDSWWINMEYGDEDGPQTSKYIYPIDKMRILVERYDPSFSEDVERIANVIWYLRGNNDPEDQILPQHYYYEYIKKIQFSEISESIEKKFKVINQEYNQKRNRKKNRKFLPAAQRLLFILSKRNKKLISH